VVYVGVWAARCAHCHAQNIGVSEAADVTVFLLLTVLPCCVTVCLPACLSAKLELGEGAILSEPELHTVELGPDILFAVAVTDGVTGRGVGGWVGGWGHRWGTHAALAGGVACSDGRSSRQNLAEQPPLPGATAVYMQHHCWM
jgi:hypothetical protein